MSALCLYTLSHLQNLWTDFWSFIRKILSDQIISKSRSADQCNILWHCIQACCIPLAWLNTHDDSLADWTPNQVVDVIDVDDDVDDDDKWN